VANPVKVARLSELLPGAVRVVQMGDTSVALWNDGGTLRATAAICPHRGGPLHEGKVADGVVTCPWHGFQFSLVDGRCRTVPTLGLTCYAPRVEGDEVWLEIS
jgi:nitrite reductase/ring-hydroxylating ferredoxin subunit